MGLPIDNEYILILVKLLPKNVTLCFFEILEN